MSAPLSPADQDRMVAAVDLGRRAGAKSVEIGYDPPDEDPKWYATCEFRGAALKESNYGSPVDAVEALAFRLLRGAKCRRCNKKIVTTGGGKRSCLYQRVGQSWFAGCGKPIDGTIPLLPEQQGK